jgi:LPS-assembly protein
LTLRDTFYTQQYNQALAIATGKADSNLINRKALETTFEIRPPALEKIYDRAWLGRRWKHVFEPRATYRYVTGVNNFPEILRFDYRDILTDTNEIEYAVENRIYAKRLNPDITDCEQRNMATLTVGEPPPASAVPWEAPNPETNQVCSTGPREVLSWELAQKYFFDPTFGHALVPGTINMFTSTEEFTGINFLTNIRNFSPIISRLRIETSLRTNTEWDLDYDLHQGRINSSTALVNYRYGPFTFGGGDAFLRLANTTGTATPGARDFHQFRILFGYGDLQKRGLNAATSFGFDANQGYLQYSTVQTTYNWDCCGFSVEYRRFALGLVRNENQFRFSFTLANVGAFGNLRRRERLF